MWIITSEVNDYNQFGEYFISAFSEKPSIDQLKLLFPDQTEDFISNLYYDGGGRMNKEDEWFFLIEVNEGEYYNAHY